MVLRKALWAAGLRYRKDFGALPGRPDIVFGSARVVVFCDGDFWHGRHWVERKRKLTGGANADYWVTKIERNMARDRERTDALERDGWMVFRLWETDILRDPAGVAGVVHEAVRERTLRRGRAVLEAST